MFKKLYLAFYTYILIFGINQSFESIFGNLICFSDEGNHFLAKFFCGGTHKVWLHHIEFTSFGMIYYATSLSYNYSASCNVPWLEIVNVIGVALTRSHIAQSKSSTAKAASTIKKIDSMTFELNISLSLSMWNLRCGIRTQLVNTLEILVSHCGSMYQ